MFSKKVRNMFVSYRSLLFYIPFIAVNIVVFIATPTRSALLFLQWNSIFGVLLCTFVPIISVHTAQNINEYEFSLLSKKRVNFYSISSILLFFTPVLIIMPLFTLPSLLSDISYGLKFDIVFYITIKAAVQIVFFTAFGFLIGRLSTSKMVYFVSFAATILTSIFFNSFLLSQFASHNENLSKDVGGFVPNLLNIDVDNLDTIWGYAFGFSSYRGFFTDKLLFVFLALMLFSITFYTRFGKLRNKIASVAVALLSAICIVFTVSYGYSAVPKMARPYASVEVRPDVYETVVAPIYDNEVIRNEYINLRVVSYDMDIDLRKDFQNTCTVTIENIGDIDFNGDLAFKIDSSFVVLSPDFTQIDDHVKGSAWFLRAGEKASITIRYRGDVNYISPVNMHSAFVDDKIAYLPEKFAWYPKLETIKGMVDYHVTIRANNSIVSNLSNNETVSLGKEIVLNKALSTDLYILCGYYKTDMINGVTVTACEDLIYANDAFIENMRQLLLENENLYNEPLMNRSKELSIKPLSQDELASKKLLFIPAVYDFPNFYVFEDSIIIPDLWFGERIGG